MDYTKIKYLNGNKALHKYWCAAESVRLPKLLAGNGCKRETADAKGSPVGELSAKLTERFLRLAKSSELKK